MKNEQIQDTPDFKIFTKTPDGQRTESRPTIEIVEPTCATMDAQMATSGQTLFNLDSPSDFPQAFELYPTSQEPKTTERQSSGSSRFEVAEPASKRPCNEPTISLESIERMSGDRISRLKNLSVRPGSASIEELENQPAYMRRNVELNDAPASDTTNISRYSLTVDPSSNQVEIRPNNTFLHDKPD